MKLTDPTQISACLRHAVEDPDLRDHAFAAWAVLIDSVEEGDVATLLDPTFALIAQFGHSFQTPTQQLAHEMLNKLFTAHSDLVRRMVNTTPSLGTLPILQKFETQIANFKAQMDSKHQYQAFVRRCQNENELVVISALYELEIYLLDHQAFLQSASMSEQPDAVVAELIRSLLDACLKFGSRSNVAVLSSKCLGIIGCVDPSKIEIPRENRDILVLSNFVRADETVKFILFFIQEVLVNAFLSATNTRAQGFLGFAIQELLQFAGFDASIAATRGNPPDENHGFWLAIPEATRNTLIPFLTSKYVLTAAASAPRDIYPLFKRKISHQTWLCNFVFDLLVNGRGENATQIFFICRRVVRGQDIAISSFLLPFAALNVVLEGTEQQRKDFSDELLLVLSQELLEDDQESKETLVSCSHVS
jgi:serine/threonine-protein kinase ATR